VPNRAYGHALLSEAEMRPALAPALATEGVPGDPEGTPD